MNRDHINQQNKELPIWKSQTFLNILFWIAMFLTMVVGMIAKACCDNLQNNERLSWGILTTGAILFPLFVSPMVFAGIYGIIQQTPQKNLGTLIFAFQNGFFWKTILGRINQDDSFPQ